MQVSKGSVPRRLLGHSCTCSWHILQPLPQLLLSPGPHPFPFLSYRWFISHFTISFRPLSIHSIVRAPSLQISPPTPVPIPTCFPLSAKRTWLFCSSRIPLPGLGLSLWETPSSCFPLLFYWSIPLLQQIKSFLPSHLLHGHAPWKNNFHFFLQSLFHSLWPCNLIVVLLPSFHHPAPCKLSLQGASLCVSGPGSPPATLLLPSQSPLLHYPHMWSLPRLCLGPSFSPLHDLSW